MFAASTARRVGRNELHSPEESPRSSPDPDLTELLRSRSRNEYDFTNAITSTPDPQEEPDASEDEAELILFAGAPNTQQSSHKIRLASPEAASGEPGLLVKKPKSYYFTQELSKDREEELRAAALTGDAVLEMSKIPWPGCALPWKVQTVTAAGMKKTVLVGHPPSIVTVEEKAHKKTRKNKKTRIALRKKLQAVKGKEAERARLAQEREEAEREKRTKRNREKKVKKKAREKAKKEAQGGETDEIPDPTQD
ncbi:hypothetical protein DM02DRAFT_640297 [Periconia macrospinosa]|uniref:Uncharacterized protein n=1 Tax=Periconia macrospinosa TaxID=97972 RepID=A0A2V1E3V9_9PLEO|nr:hypothetical protein DM02DRAFT_640297 [Periconia macrospinosa]